MLRIKALEDGSVYFEGCANKKVVDRIGDLIEKDAWKLNNYKKNPIILFNHDHSKPVGKMISVEATDEGLMVKGRISNSKDPEISRIRDLVKEGILNSLSVGMRVEDEEMKAGVNHIKACELHEVSIVAVPMNHESQFTASTKTMQGSLSRVMEEITTQIGRKDVAKAYHKLHGYKAESIQDAAKRISEEAGLALEKAYSFLKLELSSTPDEIQNWLKETSMKNLKGQSVQAIVVPKSAIESEAELKAWAKLSGWSAKNILEKNGAFVLVQKSEESFEDLIEVDLGDRIKAVIGKLKAEEEPKPEEEEPNPEEESEEQPKEEEEIKDDGEEEPDEVVEQYKRDTAEAENTAPSFVSDEKLWEQAKAASASAMGSFVYAFAVWYYFSMGGEKKSMDTEKGLLDQENQQQPGMNDANPLDQAKQTNVLLEKVVALLEQLNSNLSTPKEEREPGATNDPEEAKGSCEEDELAKKLESSIISINKRLSDLGL